MRPGLDLREDTTALNPTLMTRNDIKAVGFNFPSGFDLTGVAAWTCDVAESPARPETIIPWSVAIDPMDPLRVVVTYDATDLLGEYVYQLRNEHGVTICGPYRLVVSPDVSTAP